MPEHASPHYHLAHCGTLGRENIATCEAINCFPLQMPQQASPQDHFGAQRYLSERKTINLRGGCKEFRDAYHQDRGSRISRATDLASRFRPVFWPMRNFAIRSLSLAKLFDDLFWFWVACQCLLRVGFVARFGEVHNEGMPLYRLSTF